MAAARCRDLSFVGCAVGAGAAFVGCAVGAGAAFDGCAVAGAALSDSAALMGAARNKTSRAEGSEGASTGGCYTTGRTPGRLPETNGGTRAPRAAQRPEGCAVEHELPEGCAVEHEPPEGCAVERERPERPRRLRSACPNAWRFIGAR